MYWNTFVILSITFCAVTVTTLEFGEIKYPGSCPKVRYITDLGLNQVFGWWYRCFSTLDIDSCFNNEGETVYAYPYNSSVAGVAICCRSATNRDEVTCSTQVGTGSLKPLSTPGIFAHEFDDQSYDTVVLDADENFLISYSCKSKSQRGYNERRVEQIYIYARSYEHCESIEHQSRKVLKQNGISWTNVKRVKHGPSIPHTIVPIPCARN